MKEVCEARYSGGRLSLWRPAERKGCNSTFVVTPRGEGRASISISGRPFPALVKWNGRKLLVCYGDGSRGWPRSFDPCRDTVLLSLTPAAPRRP